MRAKTPKRIAVIEFITAGGLAGAALPQRLAAAGEMMLRAVVQDFVALGRFDITITRDARLPSPGLPVREIAVSADPWRCWEACIDGAEAVLAIAPETGGILERLNRLVLSRDRLLLGCSPEAVAVTASKRVTARRLAARGIRVPWSEPLGAGLPPSGRGWVIKPDDGAGSEDTFFVGSIEELWGRTASLPARPFVIQPFVTGRALSLSLLCSGDGVRLLACNEQVRAHAGAVIEQTGVVVNGAPARAGAMKPLAAAVYRALPGLRGYVGVDLIETDEGPVVLEVNPRLTTAYVGMSRSIGANAAGMIVDACLGEAAVFCVPLRADPVTVEMH